MCVEQDHACMDLRIDAGKATSLCAGSDIILEKESPQPDILDNPFSCQSFLEADHPSDEL